MDMLTDCNTLPQSNIKRAGGILAFAANPTKS